MLSYSIFCLLVETLADPLVDWMVWSSDLKPVGFAGPAA